MEKQAKPKKNKFLRLLPRAASAVTFHKSEPNPNKLKAHIGKGFSGPIIPMIPVEARRKLKNPNFEAQEPTSPKVSCMGQIKHKKKNKMMKKEKQHVSLPRDFKPDQKKKQTSAFMKNVFGNAKAAGRKSDAGKSTVGGDSSDRAPSLSQMRRFASGRETLSNFDWAAQVAPVDADQGNYYSDEESEGEEREVIIPFSAPILVGVGGAGAGAGGGGGGGGGGRVGLEPRKEINLWKRRTMAQPRPLQVNTLVRSA